MRYHDRPGRPQKADIPKGYTYHPTATIVLDDKAVALQRNQAGRFILATNLLQNEDTDLPQQQNMGSTQQQNQNLQQQDTDFTPVQKWSNDMLLDEYKQQQSCERGFRFLKDPLFFASRVFVQTQRVAALAMIMGLCLLVYNLGQRQLRQALEQAQETIPDQKGKPTVKPTLRWVLQCFQSVH